MTRRNRAFTLMEVMISVAIGAVVMGSAMYLYHQGNKFFYKTTQHAAFREESLLCLEHIAKDVEQLMVSDEQKAGSQKWWLTEPYELIGNSYEFTKRNPQTGREEPTGTRAFEGIRFMRYHSTEMSTGPNPKPVLVARRIEYTVKPSTDGSGGKDLFRNGTQKINKLPLRDIAFVKDNFDVTRDQIGGSPSAILTVMIVPVGGNMGQYQAMTQDTVDRLRADKAIVSRTFHLSGFETQYTLVLNEAFRIAARNPSAPNWPTNGPKAGVYKAVYDDAKTILSQAQFQRALGRFQGGSAVAAPVFQGFDLYRMDAQTPFDDSTSGKDQFFSALTPSEGAAPTQGAGLGGGGGGGGGEGGEGGE